LINFDDSSNNSGSENYNNSSSQEYIEKSKGSLNSDLNNNDLRLPRAPPQLPASLPFGDKHFSKQPSPPPSYNGSSNTTVQY
jgi:hypothetical protein